MLRPWNLEITLDKADSKAVYLQIADAIIADIISGRLQKGTALPGSRSMAIKLGVNRNTVVEALNILINEGWLIPQERRGTFVADILPIETIKNKNKQSKRKEKENNKLIRIRFDDGHPDSKVAPIDELARAYRDIFKRKARWKMMGYADEYGDMDFRSAIVKMLNHERNMQVDEFNLCITRGSQMAMYLIAHSLLTKEDAIIVESPGYQSAWQCFENTGATLIPISVDDNGLNIDYLEKELKKNDRIKAIYITPHRQYPTTVTLSLSRRMELIRLAKQYNFTIIEDDYDYEFHFGHRPLPPISSYESLCNFIYVGTLSKVVAPALRMGYLATKNKDILEKIGQLRKIIDIQGDSIMEKAVLELMNNGTIQRHIKKATNYYKQKRDFLISLFKVHLSEYIDFHIPEGGLAVWLWSKNNTNWTDILTKVENKGVHIPLPTYYNTNIVDGIRLGYGSLTNEEMEEGILILKEVLNDI